MLELKEYRSFDDYSRALVMVDVNEIAVVRAYRYHSFRNEIGQIVLKNGVTINVWENVDTIRRMMRKEATENKYE